MRAPYIPPVPIEVADVAPELLHVTMMEAFLERQFEKAKPRKRRELIGDLHAMADNLTKLGGIRRLRCNDRKADKDLAEARRAAASVYSNMAALFSRWMVED